MWCAEHAEPVGYAVPGAAACTSSWPLHCPHTWLSDWEALLPLQDAYIDLMMVSQRCPAQFSGCAPALVNLVSKKRP